MPSNDVQEVTVIIRAAGERTEEACRRLLAEQVPAEGIVVVRERPFAAALRESFRIGTERSRPWTLCIDADVLVRDGAVAELLALARRTTEDVFEVQGMVLDKLFGGPRPAGNHLYRTALFPRALECAASCAKSVRPENDTLEGMRALGHPWKQEELVVGLHDFEQFFKDIYRKAFVHARKHLFFLPALEPYWQRKAAEDTDFRVTLLGLEDGRRHQGPITVDTRAFPQEINALLTGCGLSEKGPLAPDAYTGARVADHIERHQRPPEYAELRRLWDGLLENATQEKNKVRRREKTRMRTIRDAFKRIIGAGTEGGKAK